MNSIIHRLYDKIRNCQAEPELPINLDLNEPGYYQLPDSPDVEEQWDLLRRRIRQEEFVPGPAQNRINTTLKLAIGCGMICILAFFSYQLLNRMNNDLEFSTVYRQQKTVVLPEQSVVQLNCDSKIVVDNGFNNRSRNVHLTGEACFHVTAGKHPFIISTETGTVRVVGTEFNVKDRNHRIEVAVNEGFVQLTVHNSGRDSTIRLAARQYTSCRAGQFPEPPQTMAFNQFPVWMNGKITVNNSSFRHVCDEIERRFNVKINIADAALEDTEITGLFDAGNIDEILNALSILVNKEFHFENQTIIFDTFPSHSDSDN